MPDYSKGKIYKITSSGGLPYIGSTIQKLSQRMAEHKRDKTDIIKKCSSTLHTNQDDCVITLIEDYPCENKEQLLSRERYWYELIPNCNKQNPLLTLAEKEFKKKSYQSKRIGKRKDYFKEYYKGKSI